MSSTEKIQEMKHQIERKIVLTDYDLGVLNTLKWILGDFSPYDGRVE